ncbi:MAG: hypothetical protein KGJ75_17820 [Alphaproteobacteria bacterium]|nr:hypothetical protein [Alphaproteobacteria bacterium]
MSATDWRVKAIYILAYDGASARTEGTNGASGESGWYNGIDTAIGGVGVLSDATKYSAGAATLGINLRNIFNSKIYANGWGGNQYVWATGIADAAKSLGDLSVVAGVGLDFYGYGTGQISGTKLGVDLAIDGIGAFGGLPGAAAAGAYYGLEKFYPGGAAGALTFYGNIILQNEEMTGQPFYPAGKISFHPDLAPCVLPPSGHKKKKWRHEVINPYDCSRVLAPGKI